MYTIAVRARFNASHSIRIGASPRDTPHEHEWLVEVELAADEVDGDGLVLDFRRVERLLADCVADFDGALLDELPEFAAMNPTAENVARLIDRRLKPQLALEACAHERCALARVTVWETPTCGATYRRTP